jgi:hypothetical protein
VCALQNALNVDTVEHSSIKWKALSYIAFPNISRQTMEQQCILCLLHKVGTVVNSCNTPRIANTLPENDQIVPSSGAYLKQNVPRLKM